MTESEYEQLKDVLDSYVDENGVVFGFVGWLLNDYNSALLVIFAQHHTTPDELAKRSLRSYRITTIHRIHGTDFGK